MTDGVSENAREQREREAAVEENAKRQKSEAAPEPEAAPKPPTRIDQLVENVINDDAESRARINTLVKEVLTQVGAMDADGEGITMDGLTDLQRVQLALKLQKAIELVQEMPVVDSLENATAA